MIVPTVTAFYAALFGLLLVGLSVWVSMGRARFQAHHGDGGEEGLSRRIRAHGNFTEYVPLILLLMALAEASGAAPRTMHMLALPLLLARLCHPVGMLTPVATMQQFVLRGLSVIVTWIVLFSASIVLLMRVW